MSHFSGEIALQLGTMYSGEEALKLRLVDELVDQKDLMSKCVEQMKKWIKIPSKRTLVAEIRPLAN